MSEVYASRPEPPPKPQGRPVTPELVAWLRSVAAPEEVIAAVHARDTFGRAKYGQPLMTEDGRDAVEDCRQELADALQYAYRGRMTGVDMSPIKPLLSALFRLLEQE